MLAFVVFAFTVFCFLIGLVVHLYPGRRSRPSTVPGIDPSDSRLGNLSDISEAGSFHEFLKGLHELYGPVASFWFGEQYVVSTSHPDTFRPQVRLFDRPCILFKLFEPLIGKGSIQYMNGDEGRTFRRKTDGYFSHESCCKLIPKFVEVASDVERKWVSMGRSGKPIPLRQYMIAMAFRGIMLTLFGDYFKDDERCFAFGKDYDICWSDMESSLAGDASTEGGLRSKLFEQAKHNMRSTLITIIKDRQMDDSGERLLVDEIYDACGSDEQTIDVAISYVIGGFHTTGNLLTWIFYFLITHSKVLAKVVEELDDVLTTDEALSQAKVNDLVYCRQVIDESLRLSVLAPWAARYSQADLTIAGHLIPKETPIVQALGVACESGDLWENPEKFDPDRFAQDKSSFGTDSLSCPFFGFAGKRKCPGYRFAYFEALCFMSVFLRRFTMKLANPEQAVEPIYGLVTHPAEEIYILVEQRKS